MLNKTYGQLCPIARSLDVLGERWTLLVVRELLLGPKRFKELLAALPAMGTNRMSARLKMLVENGIAQSNPNPNATYELTPLGERLRTPLLALGVWGLSLPVDERIDSSSARAELIALSLTAISSSDVGTDFSTACDFYVGDEVFHILVNNGEARTHSGRAPQADITVQCDLETFMALALLQISPQEAIQQGLAYIKSGQTSTFETLFQALQYSPEKLSNPSLPMSSRSSLAGEYNES